MTRAVARQLVLAGSLEAVEFTVEGPVVGVAEHGAHAVACGPILVSLAISAILGCCLVIRAMLGDDLTFDAAGTALTLRVLQPGVRGAG